MYMIVLVGIRATRVVLCHPFFIIMRYRAHRPER
jgi:hypothetical protein